ncbi:MAG TPA: hypothetical protein DIC56_02475 [Rhizobium sp.]|nr:hypothetical protein [Rhizobium sp.]
MSKAPITKIDIPLSVPVTVSGADGRNAERSTITLCRPKTRHTKRLAILIGPDLIDLVFGDDTAMDALGSKDEGQKKEVGRRLIGDALRRILTTDALEELTALIADMSGEDKAVIDDIDLADLPKVLMGFGGFFPELQSKASGLLLSISQSSAE